MSRYREALSKDVIAIHDKQKDFSETFWQTFVERFQARVALGARVVDAGAGSGVVATRLSSAGFEVTGFDFNASMLAMLRARTSGQVPPVLADITALPLRAGCAEAVLITNVLHLLRDWRTAVAEAAHVLVPGGLLLVGLGNTGRSATAAEIASHFRDAVGDAGTSSDIGVQTMEDFDAALRELALIAEEPLVVGERGRGTVRYAIERLQHNVFTWPPDLPQATLDAAAASTCEWARERFGSLDAEYEVEAELFLHVARKA